MQLDHATDVVRGIRLFSPCYGHFKHRETHMAMDQYLLIRFLVG